jgi:hypothetical protein
MSNEPGGSGIKTISRREMLGWALGLFAVSPLLLLLFFRNPEEERRLAILRQMATETPVYPDFKQVSVSEGAKSARAFLIIGYSSNAGFDDVKHFYGRALTLRGWEVPGGNEFGFGVDELIFRKGAYKIAVGYRDGEYSVSHRWEGP